MWGLAVCGSFDNELSMDEYGRRLLMEYEMIPRGYPKEFWLLLGME